MKYTFLSLITIAFALFSQEGNTQITGNKVFHTSLEEMSIECDCTLDELKQIYFNEIGLGNYSYKKASISYAGEFLDSIGVRAKGGISFFDAKTPLKLDFNYYKDQKLDGHKKLNLHQGNTDPTFLRETLSYNILRSSGVKTARTGLIKLTFNGANLGIYNVVEQINDDFVNRRFASDKGALYKTGGLGLDVKYIEDDSFTYDEFISTVNDIPTSQLHVELPKYLDMESFLRFFATEVFLNSVDGPLSVDYNYYLYYEPTSKKYFYIPWDYNLSLYGFADFTIFKFSPNFIFPRVIENEELRSQYLDVWCTLLQSSFHPERILKIIEDYESFESDFTDEINTWESEKEILKNTILARHETLTTELEEYINSCPIIQKPFSNDAIVINEIVASNDSTSTIMDPNGGHADWIELYNSSSEDIVLNECYLTNNIQIEKLWKFPSNTTIKAKDYLIIWADRDIDEEGLHTNFKLNKHAGQLYLTFEDGTIIDGLEFNNQETNMGYARFPNGHGDFQIQESTFNASNGGEVSTQELEEQNYFKIGPNPVSQHASIELYSQKKNEIILKLMNANGQIIDNQQVYLSEGSNKILKNQHLQGGLYYIFIMDKNQRLLLTEKIIVY